MNKLWIKKNKQTNKKTHDFDCYNVWVTLHQCTLLILFTYGFTLFILVSVKCDNIVPPKIKKMFKG